MRTCKVLVEDLSEVELQSCRFIPLEEALHDFGFKKNGSSFYCKKDGYLVQWTTLPQLNGLLKIKHVEKDDVLHLHGVEYLHQLQNIYKVFTGKEL
jgi:hypothetical protein